ncbi:nucleotidyl transferase AbiEii/AbiGii toxin family protein [Corynebacterium testudinoris]|uniref:nucleotidyl transferase AbiEii/AbiGii toxin family protein n=1 Tax=Corynebacterium testudinoris TaxID=136857 RepID=UPI001C8BADC0|nr:nucleotidyl transferase AbiEii/AbiGii toxin family protein [Corynebacterium testudinoris]MBX8995498.1 nucleotidyl transferase AbiEii/AbiGii toxin family protein [Corynebacterium testudinoris]
MNPNEAYNRFFRELFLAELMSRDQGWVLKGGTNLYCQIPGARHTRDLDLYRQDDPTSFLRAAAELVETMDEAKIGSYRFNVSIPKGETVDGAIDNISLKVEIFYGVNPVVEFGIDVSGDLHVPVVTDFLDVQRSDGLDLEFMERDYRIRSYPIENQIADKISAMYELHGLRQQPSTRYRDLYDIALISLELRADASRLAEALRIQAKIRCLTLPLELHLPSSEWADGYARLIGRLVGPRQEIIEVNDALRIAGALANPILSSVESTVTGEWSPDAGRWI